MYKKFSIILLLICTACSAPSSNRLSRKEINSHLASLEHNINKQIASKHGKLILKYDLLQLENNQEINHCPSSKLFNRLIARNPISKDQYLNQIEQVKEQLSARIKNKDDFLRIAYINAERKIEHLKQILPQQLASKVTITKVNKVTKTDIFQLIDDEEVEKYFQPKTFTLPTLNKKLAELNQISQISGALPILTPLPQSILTSDFKMRKDPFTKKLKAHKGIDLQAAKGAVIYAAADGIVKFAGQQKNYGNLLIIDHGMGYSTRYGHLAKFFVHNNEKIHVNQPIATQGHTGRCTAEHLHYEVRFNDKPIDPKTFIALGKGCHS